MHSVTRGVVCCGDIGEIDFGHACGFAEGSVGTEEEVHGKTSLS
jgi:hypothetical protein